jgi:hypothetical protein
MCPTIKKNTQASTLIVSIPPHYQLLAKTTAAPNSHAHLCVLNTPPTHSNARSTPDATNTPAQDNAHIHTRHTHTSKRLPQYLQKSECPRWRTLQEDQQHLT